MRQIRLKLARGKTRNHFVALENVNASREVRGARGVEDVPRHIITVRPDTGVRVVDEVRSVRQEVIQVVITGRIGGGRNGDALMGKASTRTADDELRDNPAVFNLILHYDRSAVAVEFTNTTETAPVGGDA